MKIITPLIMLGTLSGCSVLPYEKQPFCQLAGSGFCVGGSELIERTKADDFGGLSEISKWEKKSESNAINPMNQNRDTPYSGVGFSAPMMSQPKVLKTVFMPYSSMDGGQVFMGREIYTILEPARFISADRRDVKSSQTTENAATVNIQ